MRWHVHVWEGRLASHTVACKQALKAGTQVHGRAQGSPQGTGPIVAAPTYARMLCVWHGRMALDAWQLAPHGPVTRRRTLPHGSRQRQLLQYLRTYGAPPPLTHPPTHPPVEAHGRCVRNECPQDGRLGPPSDRCLMQEQQLLAEHARGWWSR